MGIFTDAYQRLVARKPAHFAVFHDGADVVRRRDHFDNAFIILDEAQNTTPAQMKMFLTRIGFGSKVVITGDLSQKDLPYSTVSGLEQASKVLEPVNEIGFCYLTNKDVVRHPLVQKIVHAYEKYEAREQYKQNRKNNAKKTNRRDRT